MGFHSTCDFCAMEDKVECFWIGKVLVLERNFHGIYQDWKENGRKPAKLGELVTNFTFTAVILQFEVFEKGQSRLRRMIKISHCTYTFIK